MSTIDDLDATARMVHSYLNDRAITAEIDAALAAKRQRVDRAADVLNRANDWIKSGRPTSVRTTLKYFFELADVMDDITAHMDGLSTSLARTVMIELDHRAFDAVGRDVLARMMALHSVAMTPEVSEETRSAARATLNREIASAKAVAR